MLADVGAGDPDDALALASSSSAAPEMFLMIDSERDS